MTKEQIEKWKSVKEALEKAGKTDNHYYKRAATVVKTGVDPGPDAFF